MKGEQNHIKELREKQPFPSESFVLGLSMFVMGGCGLAYEYTFSKVASDLLGNSIRQWAIIIGVMLFFMGLGADLQKHLSDRKLFDRFILFEIFLGLLGGFGPICMLFVYGSFPSHYIIVQYFFICGVGFLIGLEIPLITRINEAYSANLSVNLGRILKMDYIGSLCGALVWIFILPRFFTIIEMAFVLALLTIAVAGFAFFYFRAYIVRSKSIGVLLLASLIGLMVAFWFARDWTAFAEQRLYRDRVIFSQTTDYQHIVVTRSPSGEVSCYINGRLQFNSSDEFIYHENLVHPAMSIAPRRTRVLILGGGDGLALREVLKYPDVEQVTLVDLDPVVTDLAQYNANFTRLNNNSLSHAKLNRICNNALIPTEKRETIIGPNVHHGHRGQPGKLALVKILNIDASQFIEQVSGRYDVVILDFPDPNTIELAKLYSKNFYSLLISRMSADGIVVQQSTSPFHAREAFLCIGRTFEAAGMAVVPYHDNVPSFGEWGWWIGGNERVYSAVGLRKKLEEVKRISVETRYLSPSLIQASLSFGKGMLYSGHNEITTISSAKVYDFYLEGWRAGE